MGQGWEGVESYALPVRSGEAKFERRRTEQVDRLHFPRPRNIVVIDPLACIACDCLSHIVKEVSLVRLLECKDRDLRS